MGNWTDDVFRYWWLILLAVGWFVFRGQVGTVTYDYADNLFFGALLLVWSLKSVDNWLKNQTPKMIFNNDKGWCTTFGEWISAGGYAIVKRNTIDAWEIKTDYNYDGIMIFPQTALLNAKNGRSLNVRISFEKWSFSQLPHIVKSRILQYDLKEPFYFGILDEEELSARVKYETKEGTEQIEAPFLVHELKMTNEYNSKLVERIKRLNDFIEETKEWVSRVHPEEKSLFRKALDLTREEKTDEASQV